LIRVEFACHKALRESPLSIGEPGHVAPIIIIGNGMASRECSATV
jgi:hypothetical protein